MSQTLEPRLLLAGPSETTIIDEGEAGFVATGAWVNVTGSGKGYHDDFAYATSGDGSKIATWTFDVDPGQYNIFVSWRAWSNRATDAPFTVLDGATAVQTFTVNQQLAAAPDAIEDGTNFQKLGTVAVTGNQLVVELSDQANGLVVADAIRIEQAVLSPEVSVSVDGVSLENGSGILDFGEVLVGETETAAVTVTNVGSLDLLLDSPIQLTGFDLANDFTSTMLSPGSSTTFEIDFAPTSEAGYSGDISFTSNDPDDSPFEFSVVGQGVVPSDAGVIDNGDSGFTTVGSWTTVSGAGKGYGDDFEYAAAGDGSSQAHWTFHVPAGEYAVSASWRAWSNRATDAPFAIFDGTTLLTTVHVDQQQQAVADVVVDGTNFQDLSTVPITSGQLVVRLANDANGLVSADAIHVEKVGSGSPSFTFVVSESDDSTLVFENGSTDTLTVVLETAPSSNVVLDVTGTDPSEATVSPSQLTFTPSDWNVPQTVTVTGIDDGDMDGDQVSNVVVQVNEPMSDPSFAGLPAQLVQVTTVDSGQLSWSDDGSVLTITGGDGDDEIHVREQDGWLVIDSGTRRFATNVSADPSSTTRIDIFAAGGDDFVTVDPAITISANIDGGDGNDTLHGGGGDDIIEGELGSDVLRGYAGDDHLIIDADDSETLGGEGQDIANAGGSLSGVQLAMAALGFKHFWGSPFDDHVTAEGLPYGAHLYGFGGNDTLIGGDHVDVIFGGDDDDLIIGRLGVDGLDGQAGNNTVFADHEWSFDSGTLRVDGSSSNDAITVAESVTGTIQIAVVGGSVTDTEHPLANVTLLEIYGGDGDDALTVGSSLTIPAQMFGGDGDDVLTGGGSNDVLHGQGGSDSLYGRAGDYDWLFVDHLDSVIDGGPGILDLVDATYSPAAVNLQMAGAAAERFWGSDFDDFADATGVATDVTLKGKGGNDTLLGSSNDDDIDGGAGDDTIRGSGGDDAIHGGIGVDELFGDAGDDHLQIDADDSQTLGGEGDDIVDAANSAIGVALSLAELGFTEFRGSPFADNVTAAGLPFGASLYGYGGDDVLIGTDFDDHIEGGAGADFLMGRLGIDVIISDEFDTLAEHLETVIESPGQNSVIFDRTPTLVWTPAPAAASYEIEIEEVGSGIVLHQSNITSTSYTVSDVSLNVTEHRIRMRASDPNGNAGEWSLPHTLVVSDASPAVLMPTNGANTAIDTPTITWEAIPGISQYEIRIHEIGLTGDTTVLQKTGIIGTTYTVDPADTLIGQPLNPQQHRVWIRGVDAVGSHGSWGPASDFTILPDYPVSLEVTSITEHSATLSWDPVPNAQSYDVSLIQTYDDVDHTILFQDGIPSTFLDIIDLTPGSQYRFVVRAIGMSGNASAWSQPKEFQTAGTLPPLSIDVDDDVFREGGTMGFVYGTIRTNFPLSTDTIVSLTAVDGTAINALDYKLIDHTVTLAAGKMAVPFALDIVDNTELEETEDFQITATAGTLSASGTITILDDDFVVSARSDFFFEDEGDGEFTLRRTGDLSSPVTVNYSISSGSAMGGVDFYADLFGSVILSPGIEEKSISFAIVDDNTPEGNETLSLQIESVSAGSIGTASATATIVDDDVPTVSIHDGHGSEATGTGNFRLTVDWLGELRHGGITVEYEVSSGTADNPADFDMPLSGTFTIAANSDQSIEGFTIVDDSMLEGMENFAVTLTDVTGSLLDPFDNPIGTVELGRSTATMGIIDNEVPLEISITDTVVNESDSIGQFLVELTTEAEAPVDVTFEIAAGGSATTGVDFVLLDPLTITIPVGVTSVPISFALMNDTNPEPPETFSLTLLSTTDGAIDDGTGVATIVDDELAVEISAADEYVSESSPIPVGWFDVTLSAPLSFDVTLDYSVVPSGNTAVQPADYTLNDGTLTIVAGTTTAQLLFDLNDDALNEPTEKFRVALSNPSFGTIITPVVTAHLLDDESTVLVSIDDVIVNEADGSAAFPVTTNVAVSHPLVVTYDVVSPSTAGSFDYNLPEPRTVTIPAGANQATIPFTVLPDNRDEWDEFFSLAIVDLSYGIDATGTATATIQDWNSGVSVSIADATFAEGDGAGGVIVRTSEAVLSPLVVRYSTHDGTAIAGSDYSALTSETLIIPVGADQGIITLPLLDDSVYEPDETLTVIIDAVNYGSLGQDVANVQITNDDADISHVTITVDDLTVDEHAGTVTGTVRLSEPVSTDITLDLSASGGGATPGTDYQLTDLTVTIAAFGTSGTFKLEIVDDSLKEAPETFDVTAAVGAQVGSGTVTITDNEPNVSLQLTQTAFPEDSGVVSGTVVADRTVLTPYTVELIVTGGTASRFTDYSIEHQVVIPAGSDRGSFAITILEDSLLESDETFDISIASNSLGSVSGSTYTAPGFAPPPPDGTVTILDNDVTVGVVDPDPHSPIGGLYDFLEGATYSDGGPYLTLYVTRPNLLTDPVAVNLVIGHVADEPQAIQGGDFELQTSVTIDPSSFPSSGSTNAVFISVPLTIIDDSDPEPMESFTVGVSVLSGSSNVHAGASAVIHIADNDPYTLSISGNTVITEGSSAVATLELNGELPHDLTLNLSGGSTGITPIADANDYTITPNSVTIPAGSTEVQVTVAATDDPNPEPTEYFRLTATGAGFTNLVDYSIVDNDTIPTLTLSGATSITEGDTGQVIVSISSPVHTDLIVSLQPTFPFTPAANSGDFSLSALSLTIPAGETSATIDITAVDDSFDEPDELFTMTASAEINGQTITDSSDHTIIDDDDGSGPTLSLSPGKSLLEGTSDEDAEVTLSDALTYDLTVTLTGSGSGSDIAEPSDYSLSTSVTIPAGQTSVPFHVAALQDALSESTEGFTVTAAAVIGTQSVADSSTYTIIDDDDGSGDTYLRLNSGASITEGNSRLGRVSITSVLSTDLIVSLSAYGSGSPQAQTSDYSLSHSSVMIPAGATSATFDIVATEDSVSDPNEKFTVIASAVIDGESRSDSAQFTIIDNDFTFVIYDNGFTEGVDGEFIIARIGSYLPEATVEYHASSTESYGATPGLDFDIQGSTVSFGAGETQKTVSVTVHNDNYDEPEENFIVTLSSPSFGSISDRIGNYTIADTNTLPGNQPPDVTRMDHHTCTAIGTIDYPIDVDDPDEEHPNSTLSFNEPGAGFEIVGAGTDSPKVRVDASALGDGTHEVDITATDPSGASDTDTFTVTITSEPPQKPDVSVDQRLHVLDGDDEGAEVNLNWTDVADHYRWKLYRFGIGSDGQYGWQKYDEGAGPQTEHTAASLPAGIYSFEVRSTGCSGSSDPDTVYFAVLKLDFQTFARNTETQCGCTHHNIGQKISRVTADSASGDVAFELGIAPAGAAFGQYTNPFYRPGSDRGSALFLSTTASGRTRTTIGAGVSADSSAYSPGPQFSTKYEGRLDDDADVVLNTPFFWDPAPGYAAPVYGRQQGEADLQINIDFPGLNNSETESISTNLTKVAFDVPSQNLDNSPFGKGVSLPGLDFLDISQVGAGKAPVYHRGNGTFVEYETTDTAMEFDSPDGSYTKVTSRSDGTWEVTTELGETRTFDGSGLLTSITSPEGKITQFQYKATDLNGDGLANELESVTDVDTGETVTYAYDSGTGMIDTVTHSLTAGTADDKVWGYDFMPDGRLEKVTLLADPATSTPATATKLVYAADGSVTLQKRNQHDAVEESTTVQFDQWDNVRSVTVNNTSSGDSQVWDFTSAESQQLSDAADSSIEVTKGWTQPNLDASPSAVIWAGPQSTVTLPGGDRRTVMLDSFGNTLYEGQTTQTQNGQVDVRTHYVRNRDGQIVETVGPYFAPVNLLIADPTDPASIPAIPADALRTTYQYDSLKRLIRIDYPDNGTETWSFETSADRNSEDRGPHQPYSYKDQLGRVTTYAYDTDGMRTRVTTNSAFGDLLSDTEYVYADGLLVAEKQRLGINGTVQDSDSPAIGYYYDDMDRLIHTRYTTTADVGAPPSASAAIDAWISQGYDNFGHLAFVTSQYRTTSFDAQGRPVVPGSTVRTEFVNDRDGNVTRMTLPDPDGSGPLARPVYEYEYNDAGMLEYSLEPPRPGQLEVDRKISYTYDGLGRLKTVTTPDPDGTTGPLQAETVQYVYDDLDNIVQERVLDGSGTLQRLHLSEYNSLGWMLWDSQDYLFDVSTDDIDDHDRNRYFYDAHGRVREFHASGGYAGADLVYTYSDTANSYAVEDPDGNVQRWTYDAGGRLIKEELEGPGYTTATGLAVAPVSIATNYTYHEGYTEYVSGNGEIMRGTRISQWQSSGGMSQNHRYTFVGAFGQTLVTELSDPDGSGPLTQSYTTYTYDTLGHLVSVTEHNGANYATALADPDTRTSQFEYNTRGERIREITPDPDGAGTLPALETNYKYDNLGRLTNLYWQKPQDDSVDPQSPTYDHGWYAETVYEYFANGLLKSEAVLDGSGDTSAANDWWVDYDYDNLGRQIRATTPNADNTRDAITDYAYNQLGFVETVTAPDPDGSAGPDQRAVTTYRYGYRIPFTPNLPGIYLTEVDTTSAQGIATTRYQYDDAGRIATVELPDPSDGSIGGIFQDWTYDDLNRVKTASTINAAGSLDKITYEYGHLGWLDSVGEQGSQRRDRYEYDSFGNISAKVDPLGRRQEFEHDQRGRLTEQKRLLADGSSNDIVTTAYDDFGRVYQTTRTAAGLNSIVTTYQYDALDRQTRITDGDNDGNYQDFRYQQWGPLERYRNEYGQPTHFQHDYLGRVVEVKNAEDQNRIQYSYNAFGQVDTETRQLGGSATATTTYRYDDLGRLIEEQLPQAGSGQNGSTIYGYDSAGNLISLTDPSGNVTTWEYDHRNRKTREEVTIDGVNHHRTWTYTNNDLLQWYRDRNGDWIGYDYQFAYGAPGNHLITQEKWFEDHGPAGGARYHYDTTGLLVEDVTTHASAGSNYFGATQTQLQFTYDDLGRVTNTRDFLVGFGDSSTWRAVDVINRYDAFDRKALSSLKFVEVATAGASERHRWDATTYYNWNTDNRVTALTQYLPQAGTETAGGNNDPDSRKRVDIGYFANGDLETITRTEGEGSTLSEALTSIYTLADGGWYQGRYGSLVHSGFHGGSSQAYSWTYEDGGRIESFTTPDGTRNYNYDDLGQLTAVSGSITQTQTYDANGNRTESQFDVGDHNRLLEDADYRYQYDPEGRRIRRTLKSDNSFEIYDWNVRGLLVSVTRHAAGTGGMNYLSRVEYEYDGLGRRIRRKADADGNGIFETRQRFVYDTNLTDGSFHEVVLVLDETESWADPGGNTFDPAVARRFLNGPLVDQVFAAQDGQTGETLWLLQDNQQTVTDVARFAQLDSDTAREPELVNHLQYDAFGNIISQTNPEYQPLQTYTGQILDDVTGLMYYDARWFDPGINQFVSNDPIGFAAGDANLRRYVGNSNPNATDPSGMQAWQFWPKYSPNGSQKNSPSGSQKNSPSGSRKNPPSGSRKERLRKYRAEMEKITFEQIMEMNPVKILGYVMWLGRERFLSGIRVELYTKEQMSALQCRFELEFDRFDKETQQKILVRMRNEIREFLGNRRRGTNERVLGMFEHWFKNRENDENKELEFTVEELRDLFSRRWSIDGNGVNIAPEGRLREKWDAAVAEANRTGRATEFSDKTTAIVLDGAVGAFDIFFNGKVDKNGVWRGRIWIEDRFDWNADYNFDPLGKNQRSIDGEWLTRLALIVENRLGGNYDVRSVRARCIAVEHEGRVEIDQRNLFE